MERRTRSNLEAATKTIDRAREENEEYKRWMLRKSRNSQDPGRDREMVNPSSSINRLSSRSMVGESTPSTEEHETYQQTTQERQ